VYEVPEAGRASRGKAIVNFLDLGPDEKIAALIRTRDFPSDRFLVFATERGTVKKTNFGAFANPRAGGIIAIRVEEGDRLIGVRETAGNNELMLVTRQGMSIRFHEEELRDQGRDTIGVRGITLGRDDDAVVAVEVVNPNETLLCVSEHGYGKRTAYDEYRRQNRGGKGIITMKTGGRNGALVAAHSVHENEALMLITQAGQMIRIAVNDVRIISRNTQGVRLIQLAEGDRLVSATPVEPEMDENGENDRSGNHESSPSA
jgi:DNA gyrase subunit A